MFASKDDSIHENNDYISNDFISSLALCNDIIKQFSNPQISTTQKYCLFLDIDGTISEFHPNPNLSFIASSIIEDLQILKKSEITVLFVTGRSMQDATRLLSPLDVPIAATHGLELRTQIDSHIQSPSKWQDFNKVLKDLEAACRPYPNLRIEQKKYAIALHYREAPQYADIAQDIMHQLHAKYSDLKLNQGKFVFELMLKDADKGQAILKLIDQLTLQSLIPIFIGDDQTDESGFKVIRELNGISIKVGEGATFAQYRLKDVSAVREFIHLLKTFALKQKNQIPKYLHNEEHRHV
ncbi:trehalose-phosphatase [Acinetobacter shaoyimingii]|uniref:Trehalose 6-phosphate phosphatase n=1 Tax=Acinetobacter shaoyimingii TaxID=2715164 RepID=A0A6G8RVL8_9GAMM|nr:trehalose-phosphatase [Acinetobacter shaoyimingii]QIO05838.1 trehalose-phosphatase [Acinetobacter shaoyimingii]